MSSMTSYPESGLMTKWFIPYYVLILGKDDALSPLSIILLVKILSAVIRRAQSDVRLSSRSDFRFSIQLIADDLNILTDSVEDLLIVARCRQSLGINDDDFPPTLHREICCHDFPFSSSWSRMTKYIYQGDLLSVATVYRYFGDVLTVQSFMEQLSRLLGGPWISSVRVVCLIDLLKELVSHLYALPSLYIMCSLASLSSSILKVIVPGVWLELIWNFHDDNVTCSADHV